MTSIRIFVNGCMIARSFAQFVSVKSVSVITSLCILSRARISSELDI